MKKFYPVIFLFSITLISCTVGPIVSEGEIFKNLTAITEGEGDNYDPAISSDGTKILFVSERDGDPNIYLRNNVTSKSDIKKTEHKASELYPCFSSDGKRFCFASNINGNFDIYYMNTDIGYAKTQVTSNLDDEIFPNWSPNDDLILYSQYSSIDNNWYLWTKNMINGQNTQICKGLLGRFSKSGKSFYYKKADKNNFYQLWKIDIDGNNDTQLTSGEDWGVGTYCISPNEDKILFATYKSTLFDQTSVTDGYDLWAINLSNGDLIQVTNHKGSDFSPVWSPDGNIFFASDRSGKINIWSFKSPF
ncbi:MAG TPA: DPP IV N-terminal domain-containing protein [Ignavibacteriaceae bacterium]|nr:DPP IV N-terminal domain-containing protein [Ignavibacteriaceae bacterium]